MNNFLKLRSYFNLLSIHPSVYQSIATSLTCPPTHFPLTSSFNFIIIPSPFGKSLPLILLPSNYPPSDASLHPPSTHSFFHLIIIPSPLLHEVLLELAIYLPPVILRSFQSIPLPLSSRFPVCSLANPLFSVRHLNSVTCFLPSFLPSFPPVYAPFLFISADACVSGDTSPSLRLPPSRLRA